MSWSDSGGNLTGVYRHRDAYRFWVAHGPDVQPGGPADHDLRTDFRATVRGARHFELTPAGAWRLVSHDADTGYGARVRPFFVAAVAAGSTGG